MLLGGEKGVSEMERPQVILFCCKNGLKVLAKQTFLKSADALPEPGLAFEALNARISP